MKENQEMGQVEKEIEHLEKGLEQQGEAIAILKQRLETVLLPADTAITDKGRKEPELVPLAARIRVIGWNIKVHTNKLSDIMARLEL